ncbi:hypothetical protein SDJN03_00347, partial [Cucurbita argyrosperma subsp. sororia]
MAPSAAIFLSLLLSSYKPLRRYRPQLQPSPLLPPPPFPPLRFTYSTLSSPPPPPRFIYTTGVPSDLYQNDEKNRWYYFSGAVGKPPAMAALVVVGLAYGALDLMVFGKW